MLKWTKMGSTQVVTVRIHPNPIFSMEFYCIKLIVASFISCFCTAYNDVLLIRQIWFLHVEMDQNGINSGSNCQDSPKSHFLHGFLLHEVVVLHPARWEIQARPGISTITVNGYKVHPDRMARTILRKIRYRYKGCVGSLR
jgi:hypothetical protein